MFLTAGLALGSMPALAEDAPKGFIPLNLKADAERQAHAAEQPAPVTQAEKHEAPAAPAQEVSHATVHEPAEHQAPAVEPSLPPATLPEAGRPLPPPEVRVLIDISGSMKRTDPNNLRAPALRLLVGLLPQEAQGGLWFFGDDVRGVLSPAAVTESWRKSALAAAGRITSDAPYTNIGAALEAAMKDWSPAPASQVRRHVILLTDGMVDIGKEEGVNPKARADILDALLPRAQQLGARLHTIALSAEADHDLLKALARGTDGVYERTDDAAQLQRIFLHLFEKSAPRDALPLKDNAFSVDSTVAQLTLLVFRVPGAEPTRIVTPDKKAVDESSAARMPGWRWAHEDGHDLITIDRPQAGGYRIQAASDPDNRALILSDLRLNSLPLPNTLYLGERLDWGAWFTEKGELLKDERFHNQISLKLGSGPAGQPAQETYLSDQGRSGDFVAADGVVNQRLGEGLQPGPQLLTLEARSKTFTRLIRHDFDVDDSALMHVSFESPGEGAERHHHVVAQLEADRVRASEARIGGVLDCPPGEPVPVVLVPEGEGFALDLTPAQSQQACSLKLRLDGRLSNGRPISWPAPSIPLPPLPQVDPGEPAQPAGAMSWPVVAGMVGGANLFGGLLAWGLLWTIRRRQRAQVAILLGTF